MDEPQTVREIHLNITDGDKNVVALLSDAAKLSHQEIKQAMQKGCVWHTRNKHTQRLRRSKKALNIGDEIHMYHNPDILNQSVQAAQLLKDEGDYSVWYKPYGMLCQGSKWSDHTTINRFVGTNLKPQRPAFLVHRLDRATTGVMVIAHSKHKARFLAQAFEQRQTEKYYQAIVHGKFEHSENPLTIDLDIDSKKAVSHVRLISFDMNANCSLVEVKIDTGRKHQIRKHLAAIDFPIVGDRLHGIADNDEEKDLQLCAINLTVPSENSSEPISYRLPEQFCLQLDDANIN
ncbi:RluA family pseudouridine synthase [Thalassotalea crassostreae]|uniref:RluA family pseudouridine synthase n=1 Tax=Thalassotalea crassostreae TaxID=1763536 RepID=UPI0008392CFC|nr:RNA pseudouridine synthase [Thalassotalea crassostreae]